MVHDKKIHQMVTNLCLRQLPFKVVHPSSVLFYHLFFLVIILDFLFCLGNSCIHSSGPYIISKKTNKIKHLFDIIYTIIFYLYSLNFSVYIYLVVMMNHNKLRQTEFDLKLYFITSY